MGPRSLRERIGGRLSYANVMATIAVFLALGGTTIAISLPKKSVGPKQLKRNAVRERNIQPGAVSTDKLAQGAVTEAKISPSAIPLLGTLRPGQTLRGSFNVGGWATVTQDNTKEAVSYIFPLPGLVPSTVIGLNDATTPNCPSADPPQAALGRLCIYVDGVSNVEGNTVSSENNSAYGFGIRADATAAGDYGATGLWAVTAAQAAGPDAAAPAGAAP